MVTLLVDNYSEVRNLAFYPSTPVAEWVGFRFAGTIDLFLVFFTTNYFVQFNELKFVLGYN